MAIVLTVFDKTIAHFCMAKYQDITFGPFLFVVNVDGIWTTGIPRYKNQLG